MPSPSMPSFCTSSCCIGCRALAHSRRTRSSVSSPESVVKSMQVMARRSHAACHSFFTVRRATCDWARRSTALVFTRTSCNQVKSSGMPRLGNSGRPSSVASACPALASSRNSRTPSCSVGLDIANWTTRCVHPPQNNPLPTCNCTAPRTPARVAALPDAGCPMSRRFCETWESLPIAAMK